MLTAKEIPIRERKSFGQTRPFPRSHDLHIQVKCVVYCEMRNIKQFNACSQTSDRHLALTRKRKQACESRGPVRGARGRPRRRRGAVVPRRASASKWHSRCWFRIARARVHVPEEEIQRGAFEVIDAYAFDIDGRFVAIQAKYYGPNSNCVSVRTR